MGLGLMQNIGALTMRSTKSSPESFTGAPPAEPPGISITTLMS